MKKLTIMKNVENTIDFETAKKWADRWRENQGTYNAEHPIKAFNIPLIDLVQLQQEFGIEEVRAYLGIDDNWVEKLILVATDGNGNDLIDPAKGQYIYDFTTPCPPVCGTGGLN